MPLRSQTEIDGMHKRIKKARRDLAKQAEYAKVREDTLNWVMGAKMNDGALDLGEVDTEEVAEESEAGE